MSLTQLILKEIDFNPSAPALEPIIYDVALCNDLPGRVQHAYGTIIFRLRRADITNDIRIGFIAQSEIINLFTNHYPFELHSDRNVGDCAYLLTLSIGNRQIFAPPYGMGWDDYFASGGIKPIRILLPWAQVKFLNVQGIRNK